MPPQCDDASVVFLDGQRVHWIHGVRFRPVSETFQMWFDGSSKLRSVGDHQGLVVVTHRIHHHLKNAERICSGSFLGSCKVPVPSSPSHLVSFAGPQLSCSALVSPFMPYLYHADFIYVGSVPATEAALL